MEDAYEFLNYRFSPDSQVNYKKNLYYEIEKYKQWFQLNIYDQFWLVLHFDKEKKRLIILSTDPAIWNAFVWANIYQNMENTKVITKLLI